MINPKMALATVDSQLRMTVVC